VAKLPYFPFYPSDWLRDTIGLSAASRGIWIDILCFLWDAPSRGRLTLPFDVWASRLRLSTASLNPLLSELADAGCFESDADIDGNLTLWNRRMVREEKARKSHILRQRRYDSNKRSDGDLTNFCAQSDAESSSSEVREEKNSPSEGAPSQGTSSGSSESEFVHVKTVKGGMEAYRLSEEQRDSQQERASQLRNLKGVRGTA
jgi:hypothetical protein